MIYFIESSIGCWEKCLFCSTWMKYSFNLWGHLIYSSLLLFCPEDLSIDESRVLKFLNRTALQIIYVIVSSGISSMKLENIHFEIVVGSLDFLTNFLKSILLDINSVMLVCFLDSVAWSLFTSFYPKLNVCLL